MLPLDMKSLQPFSVSYCRAASRLSLSVTPYVVREHFSLGADLFRLEVRRTFALWVGRVEITALTTLSALQYSPGDREFIKTRPKIEIHPDFS